jgi:hypothetical protein
MIFSGNHQDFDVIWCDFDVKWHKYFASNFSSHKLYLQVPKNEIYPQVEFYTENKPNQNNIE